MTNDRYYQKGNPEKEPLSNVEQMELSTTLDNTEAVPIPISKYIKPEGTRSPALFVIYSGGEKRENDYFSLIVNKQEFYPRIRINFLSETKFEKGGKPKIMQFAIDKTRYFKESASDECPDGYYLLTDVDHFEQFLSEMRQECVAHDIELIISNPCFEIWLYYTEKDDKCVGFKIPDKKEKISSSLKTWVNKQIKGGVKPKRAILNIEQNIENAKKNYLVNDNGIPLLFSTQMFILAEQLLPYVKEGNNKIKEN